MKTNRGKAVALWLAIGLAATALLGVSFFLDDAVMAFVKTHATPGVLAFGRFGSHYGQWNWLMVPCIVAGIVARVKRDTEWLRILCVMVIVSILAGGIGANVLRAMTGRTRPNASPSIAQGWYGPRANGQWVVIKHEYNSFPSAHAAASMGLIFPLLLLRKKRIGWLLMPVPILIGAARICVGAHHLSDVVAGALLGMVVAVCVTGRLMARMFPGRELKEGS
ncbi:MAG: phosphatase PAP2 family protein [Chthoniobacteraceae bacterium]